MTTALATIGIGGQLEQLIVNGNLAGLSSEQRVSYYNAVCESVGLNPLTRPFEFITLNGKLVMYARRDCTDQLRKVHGVSINIAARELVEDVYVVTAGGTDRSGRRDEAIGAVPLVGLKGEARANAMMKAETKAKRRVTLSLCGLGMLDENEVDSVSGAQVYTPPKGPAHPASAPALPPASATPISSHGHDRAEAAGQIGTPHDPVTGEVLPPEDEQEDPTDVVPVYQWDHRDQKWEMVRNEAKIRPGQLKRIHVLRGELGHLLDKRVNPPAHEKFKRGEDGKVVKATIEKAGKYYAKLRELFGKDHSNELSFREAGQIVDLLEGMKERAFAKLDRGNEGLQVKDPADPAEFAAKVQGAIADAKERAPGEEG